MKQNCSLKAHSCPYKALFLIGEGNINRQIESLKTKPSLVVGTPARILQLIRQKKLRVHDVKTLVIDEAGIADGQDILRTDICNP